MEAHSNTRLSGDHVDGSRGSTSKDSVTSSVENYDWNINLAQTCVTVGQARFVWEFRPGWLLMPGWRCSSGDAGVVVQDRVAW